MLVIMMYGEIHHITFVICTNGNYANKLIFQLKNDYFIASAYKYKHFEEDTYRVLPRTYYL
jgi:hypothetical protein